LDTHPARITLCPGRTSQFHLQLHSGVDEPLRATVLLVAPPGLAVDSAPQPVEIAPRGHVSLPVAVKVEEQAFYTLPVLVQWTGGNTEHTLRETLSLPSLVPGGLIAYRRDDTVTLETERLAVVAHALEGSIAIEDKRLRSTIGSMGPLLGAPFWPSDLARVFFELDLKQHDGQAIVKMVGRSKSRNGLTLHQTLRFSAGGLLQLNYGLENRSFQEQVVSLRLAVRGVARDRERITVPLAAGAMQAPASAYPLPWNDAPRDAAAYAEPWMAWEREGAVCAVAWQGVDRVVGNAYQVGLDGPQMVLAPGERLAGPSYAFYVGDGDWRQARRALAYWAGLAADLPAALAPRPRVGARLEPRVVVTTADRAEALLVVDSGSARASDGRAMIDVDERVGVDPKEVAFQGLTRGEALSRAVRFSLPDRLVGAFSGRVTLQATLNDDDQPFAIMRLGTEALVRVSTTEIAGQPVWEVDNGRSVFRVAPGFGPSVIAWEVDGANHLASAFPQARGLSFNYPWFGGICPQLFPMGMMSSGGYLYRERFTAEELDSRDAMGVLWRGVRLSVRPEREELHDLRVEIEYATLGDSNVLRLSHRLCNLRHTEQVVQLTSYVFAGLGGAPAQLLLRGPHSVHRANPVVSFIHGQPWGSLEHQDTGRCLLMVGRQGGVSLMDWGQDGRSLGSAHEVRLAGDDVCEHVYYLVLADSLQDAQAYQMLSDYHV